MSKRKIRGQLLTKISAKKIGRDSCYILTFIFTGPEFRKIIQLKIIIYGTRTRSIT